MRFSLFFLLQLCTLNSLKSQNVVRIPLIVKEGMINANRFYRFYVNKQKKKIPSKPILLSNGDTSINYEKVFIKVNSKIYLDDTIIIMPGISKQSKIFIRTINKRGNIETIKDNYILTDFASISDSDYYHKINQIDVDSVRVFENGKQLFTTFSFFGTIVKPDWGFVKNFTDLETLTSGFSLCLISNYYLEGFYKTGNDSLKINIIINPRTNNLIHYAIDSIWYRFNTLKIYERNLKKDSEIYLQRISELSSDSFSSQPFTYKNEKLRIKKIHFQDSYIELYSSDSDTCENFKREKSDIVLLKNMEVFDVKKEKKVKLDILSKKRYYFLFTGSWCKPCNEVFEEIKKYKTELNKIDNFYVFDLENNLEKAKKYLKKCPKKWNLIYESFVDTANYSIGTKNIFKVNIYPTLITVENRQIVSNLNGSLDVLNELKFIKNKTLPSKSVLSNTKLLY